ncbi:MAG: response regulator transcription factor [Acidobacteriota bacterium]
MSIETTNHILVVDDEADVCDLLSRFLTRRGYRVDTANDGESALEAVRQNEPDIVLLDIRLPKIDGLSVLRKLRQESNGVAIITMSGVADEDTARKSLELGAADFITKPFNLPYLETSLLAKLILLEG